MGAFVGHHRRPDRDGWTGPAGIGGQARRPSRFPPARGSQPPWVGHWSSRGVTLAAGAPEGTAPNSPPLSNADGLAVAYVTGPRHAPGRVTPETARPTRRADAPGSHGRAARHRAAGRPGPTALGRASSCNLPCAANRPEQCPRRGVGPRGRAGRRGPGRAAAVTRDLHRETDDAARGATGPRRTRRPRDTPTRGRACSVRTQEEDDSHLADGRSARVSAVRGLGASRRGPA